MIIKKSLNFLIIISTLIFKANSGVLFLYVHLIQIPFNNKFFFCLNYLHVLKDTEFLFSHYQKSTL